jgi:hypothetical protein
MPQTEKRASHQVGNSKCQGNELNDHEQHYYHRRIHGAIVPGTNNTSRKGSRRCPRNTRSNTARESAYVHKNGVYTDFATFCGYSPGQPNVLKVHCDRRSPKHKKHSTAPSRHSCAKNEWTGYLGLSDTHLGCAPTADA